MTIKQVIFSTLMLGFIFNNASAEESSNPTGDITVTFKLASSVEDQNKIDWPNLKSDGEDEIKKFINDDSLSAISIEDKDTMAKLLAHNMPNKEISEEDNGQFKELTFQYYIFKGSKAVTVKDDCVVIHKKHALPENFCKSHAEQIKPIKLKNFPEYEKLLDNFSGNTYAASFYVDAGVDTFYPSRHKIYIFTNSENDEECIKISEREIDERFLAFWMKSKINS